MPRLHLFTRFVTLDLLFAFTACGGDSPSTPDSDDPSADQGDGNDGSDGNDKPADASVKKDAGHTSTSTNSSTASNGTKDAGSTGGTVKDAGSSTSGSSTSGAPKDAGSSNPLDGLGGLLGGLAGDGGASLPMSTPSDGGASDHCANLICWDVFDCAIFHADALDCGFTRCEGFVCKK